MDINYLYHNDRTQKRADQVAAKLVSLEIAPGRITAVGYGDRRSPTTAPRKEEFEDGFVEIIFKR